MVVPPSIQLCLNWSFLNCFFSFFHCTLLFCLKTLLLFLFLKTLQVLFLIFRHFFLFMLTSMIFMAWKSFSLFRRNFEVQFVFNLKFVVWDFMLWTSSLTNSLFTTIQEIFVFRLKIYLYTVFKLELLLAIEIHLPMFHLFSFCFLNQVMIVLYFANIDDWALASFIYSLLIFGLLLFVGNLWCIRCHIHIISFLYL